MGKDEPSYDHTQFGTVIIVAFCIVLAGTMLILAAMPEGSSRAPLFFTAGTLAALWLLFGWLRVYITDRTLVVSFGVGLVKRRIPLDSIAESEVVRNKWWWGFGMRSTSTGWMYNVSGLDAVLLHLDDDKTFRVGTDDADGLAKALQQDE